MSNWDSNLRLNLPDPDPVATQEWVDSILAVRNQIGNEEARRLLLATVRAARESGVDIDLINTPYVNTLSPKLKALIQVTWTWKSVCMT